MAAQVLIHVFAPCGGRHVLLEALVDLLKLGRFFSQFGLDVSGAEYVFEIDPVLLHDEPVVDDEHGVVDHLLDFLGLRPLPLQVAIAEDGAEVGQQLIQLSIEVVDLVQHKGLLIPRVFRLVLLRGEFQFEPSASILLDLHLQDLFLLG